MPSQESIDSINDTIVTQPKASTTNTALSANEKILNGTISSGTTSVGMMKQPTPLTVSSSSYEQTPQPPPLSSSSSSSMTYETYRPPISHERINPFDKNKTTVTTTSSYSYSAPTVATTTTTSSTITFKPDLTSATSGFDYSYKPTSTSTYSSQSVAQPMVYSSRDSIDKTSEPPLASSEKPSEKSSDFKRPELERKLSDADIIFGSKPTPDYSSYKYSGYSRNRSNSSFTSSTTDSDYVYGARDSRRENSFQKSLSVSSDKDGDFSHDPQVLSSRSGITNDAFSDFDSPASIKPATNKSWSNNDDDFDLK